MNVMKRIFLSAAMSVPRRFKHLRATISPFRRDCCEQHTGRTWVFVENRVCAIFAGLRWLWFSLRCRVRSYLFYWIAISSPFPTHTYMNGLPTLIT
jgi:hypothetical protein